MKTGRPPFDRRISNVDEPPAPELALRALAFLAQDDERVARFLALTGLDGSEVPAMLREPAFQLAVLDHLASDETMLIAFAEAESLPPEAVGRARRGLGGGDG
jgi:hypothetical protein